ncbi:MAG: hypothetical protein WCN89_02895, partial [bacterium]
MTTDTHTHSSKTPSSIVVAMSGGVDSSVAAYLLAKTRVETEVQLVGVS